MVDPALVRGIMSLAFARWRAGGVGTLATDTASLTNMRHGTSVGTRLSSVVSPPWRRAGARRVAEEVVQRAAALRREAAQQ